MSWLVPEEESKITQGTILDNIPWGLDPSPLGVVLSNPCDLEWGKASYILIASLVPARETIQLTKEFQQQVQNLKEKVVSPNKWDKLSKFFKPFINNQNITRYFFVDPTKVFDAPLFFVDFQHLFTLPFSKVTELEVIAKLPSPHREKMIVHFSSYISRIGVDREDQEETKIFINHLAEPYRQL